jgi:hypothetical protein
MTQPYKVCPRCGQPAVLQMPQCRRCGLPYPAQPAAAPPPTYGAPLSAASQRELARAPQRSLRQQHSNRFAFLLIAALTAVGVYLAMAGIRRPHDDVTAGAAPPQPGPSLFSASGQPGVGSGLFQERASTEETPTIHVYNEEEGTLILTLTDGSGRRYETRATPNQPGVVRVPAGHYAVEVASDLPGIDTNYGDADFRRFNAYDAAFVFASDAERIHLGD